MHPLHHPVLYAFFIKGQSIESIAATHKSSWQEVTAILNSEPALKAMRDAIRVERLRALAQNLTSRRSAISALELSLDDSRDASHSTLESRRRSADAILKGTRPSASRRTRKPKATPALEPPQPTKPLAPPVTATSHVDPAQRAPSAPRPTPPFATRATAQAASPSPVFPTPSAATGKNNAPSPVYCVPAARGP